MRKLPLLTLTLLAVIVPLAMGFQAGSPFEIRGVVTEPGTNQPVSDAVVDLRAPPAAGTVVRGGSSNALETRTTDSTGSFRFSFATGGRYIVAVRKDGYVAFGPMLRAAPTSAQVELTDDNKTRELKFILARPGVVTGQVVDDDSGKPIPNLYLTSWQSYYQRGAPRQVFGLADAVTDSDGRFTAAKVSAANYLFEVGLQKDVKDRVLTTFSARDLEKTDLDYPETFWPGGHDADSAIPLPVGSGMTMSLGTIHVRKVPLPSVHVTFAAACNAGEKTILTLIGHVKTWVQPLATVACDKDILITGFSPGSYALNALVEGRGFPNIFRGTVTFDVSDKNIAVALPLSRGIDIDGKIVLAEGTTAPAFEDIKVRTRPVGGVPLQAEFASPAIDAKGNFRLLNRELRAQQLLISGIPNTHYVKEIRYAGGKVVGEIVELNGNAIAQSLEIVIDDKPATVSGAVSDGDHPADQPLAVLVEWPFSTVKTPYRLLTVSGDANGKFQSTGLAPGEYRVFAVSMADQYRIDEPAVMEGLLRKAQKVILEPRGFQSLTLELLKP